MSFKAKHLKMKLFVLFLAIISQVSATVVHCNFWNNHYAQIALQYTCDVSRIDLTESQTILRIIGHHNVGRNNSHVAVFAARHRSEINFIFRGIKNFFPNLIGIDQGWSNITSLNGDELDEYESLQFLALDSNYLRHIPGNFLSRNDNMRALMFSWNSLSTVGENFLNVTARLVQADFMTNVCINQHANSQAQIQNLVVNMKNNCAVQEATTTTSTLAPSTTTSVTLATSTIPPPPGSCNLHETVCELREQNENLLQQNAEINARLDEMSETLIKMNQLLLELTSRPCGR